MFVFYFYGLIGLGLAVYAIVEYKRLFAYREITLMQDRGDERIKIPLSIHDFEKFSYYTKEMDEDYGTAIIFEHRASNYIAIPLGEDEALISKVGEAA
jgi:hypothetical protein